MSHDNRQCHYSIAGSNIALSLDTGLIRPGSADSQSMSSGGEDCLKPAVAKFVLDFMFGRFVIDCNAVDGEIAKKDFDNHSADIGAAAVTRKGSGFGLLVFVGVESYLFTE